jgi:hypothetical protein
LQYFGADFDEILSDIDKEYKWRKLGGKNDILNN